MNHLTRRVALLLSTILGTFAGACSDRGSESVVATVEAALDGPNGISADRVVDSQWGQGYCVRIVVSNDHPTATTGTWSVGLELGAATTFTTWDGVFSANTGSVTVTPMPHNTAIAPGGSTQFGLCASIPTPGLLPNLVSVTSDLPPVSGVVISEYKLPAAVDAEINPAFPVELWAALYRPNTLEAGTRYPLLLLMHGNHGTCGTGSNPRNDNNIMYSETGTCPPNSIVVPNHRGFDYLGQDLAARGFFVVSINTNRGINGLSGPPNDTLLIGGRGRLLLRHLQQLSRWNAGIDVTPPALGVNLTGRLDFAQVGLLGHSRGGESVVSAYRDYLRSDSPWPARIVTPVNFRGIFAIAPTDEVVGGETINPTGTPWNVLLPACDWDLRDLDGARPFDRAFGIVEPTPTFKSFYHVWGTNHNYFNSEWQVADAGGGGTITGCFNHPELFNPADFGSAAQRETARFAVAAFFSANVGVDRDETQNALFDPAFPLPVPYRVNRGYHPGGGVSESLVLEDFTEPTGTSSYGIPNQTGGSISVTHSEFALLPHDPSLGIGVIDDVVPSPSTFFQSNWAPVGTGFDLRSYDFLDVRVDRSTTGGPEASLNFRVELVNANDTHSSSLAIGDFIEILIVPRIDSGRTLHNARIPLSAFAGANLAAVRAVRFTFDSAIEPGLFLANIRATRATTPVTLAAAAAAGPSAKKGTGSVAAGGSALAAVPPGRVTSGNAIRRLDTLGADAVVVTLGSGQVFEPRAKGLVLSIGAEQSMQARHPNGSLDTVEFTLSRKAFDRIAQGDPVTVDYGASSPIVWDFGAIDKTLLDR